MNPTILYDIRKTSQLCQQELHRLSGDLATSVIIDGHDECMSVLYWPIATADTAWMIEVSALSALRRGTFEDVIGMIP